MRSPSCKSLLLDIFDLRVIAPKVRMSCLRKHTARAAEHRRSSVAWKCPSASPNRPIDKSCSRSTRRWSPWVSLPASLARQCFASTWALTLTEAHNESLVLRFFPARRPLRGSSRERGLKLGALREPAHRHEHEQ